MRKTFLLLTITLIVNILSAQDYQGYSTSNYNGVTGALYNPANIADNRMAFDFVFGGLNLIFDNNYVSISKDAFKAPNPSRRDLLMAGIRGTEIQGWGNWDTIRKESPYYWRNNFKPMDNNKDKSIYLNTRITLPSFMISINQKNAVAFNWSLRNYINIDGISPQLAKLAYEEFIYPNLWVTKLSNKNLSIQQMAWAEYGFSYARVLKQDNEHFFKAGATVKLLQGLSAAYMFIKDLKYEFITSDTLSLFKSDVSYGHSTNFEIERNNFKYRFVSNPGMGFDLGFVYEWRPDYKDYQYEMDGETGLWRKDKNKYKLKTSFAINDIGGIRFEKGALSNDFTADVGYWNIKQVDVNSIQGFDSLMTNMFGSKESETTFKMALPTNVNAHVDYHIWKPFYVNLNFFLSNFYKNRDAKVHDFTNITLTPRFDHKWFGLSIPLSYNTMSARRNEAVVMGIMLRAGPLVIGTNNLLGLTSRDIYGAGLYTLLRLPVPYGRIKDRDKDKISDKKDKCIDVPGVWEFMGCPDRDGDHIPDAEDKCPDVPGIKELQGCPDRDGDGITDAEDACPDDKGPIQFKGCPDRDGDGIIDKEDECPDEPGLAEFMGCPDKDGDGTPDKYDNCPDVFGPKEYKGCPDRDGDGILDKEDACPEVFGPVENKGCPWPDTDGDGVLDKDDACPSVPGLVELKGCPPPPPMKEKEKKILERAFNSLEFATGKDIIKPVSFPSLNDLAKLMIEHKNDWTLTLSGHTDNQGDADKNMLLSEKRSKAVKNYLVKKGVPENIVITEWFGQTRPIADNDTPQGRQKNRRVEMKVSFVEK